MNHLFCHSCGGKLSYSLAKPNFCGKCGQQLNISVATNAVALGKASTVEKAVILSEDETDVLSVPHITDFQVEYSAEQSSVTLGSLIGEQPAPDHKKRRRSLSVNEFIDEKKKER
jgi:hypothetical protein